MFDRTFKNRKHLASYLGLSPSPYASGECAEIRASAKWATNKHA
ncbi:transposase [Rhizobium leguminosarum]|nr:transposase [Rhizobium leguminosarum]